MLEHREDTGGKTKKKNKEKNKFNLATWKVRKLYQKTGICNKRNGVSGN